MNRLAPAVLIAVACWLGSAGCRPDVRSAPHPAPLPQSAASTWQRTELYFGRSIGTTDQVTDEQWQAFVRTELTPRFPAGSTQLDAQGQWTGPDGRFVAERSVVVILFHDGSADSNEKIESLRRAYVQQFSQQSVLRTDAPARVQF
jgi:hypothetical protein